MNTQQLVPVGIGGALVFASTMKAVKSTPLKVALVAVGAVMIAKNAPVVSGFTGQYL